MRSRASTIFCAATLVACTQDFGAFDPKDASDDASSDAPSDASSKDAVTDAPACNVVGATCLSNVTTCGQSCVSGYASCVQGCGGTTGCKMLCKNQQSTCDQTCVANCAECADAGACGQSMCTSSLP